MLALSPIYLICLAHRYDSSPFAYAPRALYPAVVATVFNSLLNVLLIQFIPFYFVCQTDT